MTIKSSIRIGIRDYSKSDSWWSKYGTRKITLIVTTIYNFIKSLIYSSVYCRLLPPGNRSWNLRKLIL